jgi:hypothetical protein
MTTERVEGKLMSQRNSIFFNKHEILLREVLEQKPETRNLRLGSISVSRNFLGNDALGFLACRLFIRLARFLNLSELLLTGRADSMPSLLGETANQMPGRLPRADDVAERLGAGRLLQHHQSKTGLLRHTSVNKHAGNQRP